MKPVLLVIGAGAGIGGSVAQRFAAEGYHVCLCRRSDEEGLQKMVADIENAPKPQNPMTSMHLLLIGNLENGEKQEKASEMHSLLRETECISTT